MVARKKWMLRPVAHCREGCRTMPGAIFYPGQSFFKLGYSISFSVFAPIFFSFIFLLLHFLPKN